MNREQLLSVNEARSRILASAHVPSETEIVSIQDALGRTLAGDLIARRTQPPVAVSAMDGYALRSEDVAALPTQLKRIGESVAGRGYLDSVQAGEAVRIFTGAPLPNGADAVLMQEDARPAGDFIEPLKSIPRGSFIRPAGMDFTAEQCLLRAGKWIGPTEIALAAAMDHVVMPVARKPRVAILATGDELVRPGHETVNANQVIAATSYAIFAWVRLAGGEPIDVGIAGDNLEELASGVRAAKEARADILVTLGGASVGDYDLVKPALGNEGMELSFWKIAMRPGKPLIHGRLQEMRILGLPGNPVSSMVCCLLFLLPLVRACCGDSNADADESQAALLGAQLGANDARQDYLRASLSPSDRGLSIAIPLPDQDSSLLRVLTQAQCLIVREPHAQAAEKGEMCRIIRLPDG